MIYGINDRPSLREMLLFGIQLVLSIFVATVLISKICGTNMSAALVGAGLSTLVYILITKRQSPMFVSSSGAFVAPVLFALGVGGYTAVAIGGFISCIVYCAFGLIFAKIPVENIYKIFPSSLIGAVTAVIGINLMPYILTYVQIDNVTSQWGVIIALITMFSIALISHYAKGICRILPFLLGTLVGYVCAIILTVTGIYPIVDFSVFANMKLFVIPDFAFLNWGSISVTTIISIVFMYIAYTVSAMMECLSDHAALGNIVGVDLYKKPGLSRIFIGEGVANLVGTSVGGLGICSYGEGVGCVGFSKVASTYVTITAAIITALLGFLGPVQAFITSIPSCVFAGSAALLYGFIACSGIKMLQKVDLDNQKNLIITSAVLSLGISGLILGGEVFSLSATALALVVGIILNFVLKDDLRKN